MSDDAKKSLRCSFCGKHEQQVHRMIQGPGVRICDECVQLCMRILGEEFGDEDTAITEDIPDQLPTPKEIKSVLDELGDVSGGVINLADTENVTYRAE